MAYFMRGVCFASLQRWLYDRDPIVSLSEVLFWLCGHIFTASGQRVQLKLIAVLRMQINQAAVGGAWCGRSGVYLHLGSPKQARYKRQSGLFRIDLPSAFAAAGGWCEMHTHSCSAIVEHQSENQAGSALLLLLLVRCPQILQRALQITFIHSCRMIPLCMELVCKYVCRAYSCSNFVLLRWGGCESDTPADSLCIHEAIYNKASGVVLCTYFQNSSCKV